jgi:hypothetical protein
VSTAVEPLLHEIVVSFHHPDPDRALRVRPFVYGSVRHRPAAPGEPAPRGRFRWASRGLATLVSTGRFSPTPRPAAVVGCTPACC